MHDTTFFGIKRKDFFSVSKREIPALAFLVKTYNFLMYGNADCCRKIIVPIFFWGIKKKNPFDCIPWQNIQFLVNTEMLVDGETTALQLYSNIVRVCVVSVCVCFVCAWEGECVCMCV